MKVITDQNKLIQTLCREVRGKRYAVDVDCIKSMLDTLHFAPIDYTTERDPHDAFVERAVAALDRYPESVQCGWVIEGMPVEVWLVATYGRAKDIVAACIIADLLHRAGLTDGFTCEGGDAPSRIKSSKAAGRSLGFKFDVQLGSELKPLRMPKGALWHIETDNQLYRWMSFKLLSELPRVPVQLQVINALRAHIVNGYLEGGISGPWLVNVDVDQWIEHPENPADGCRMTHAYSGVFDVYRRLELAFNTVPECESFTAGDVFNVICNTKIGRYFSCTVEDKVVWIRSQKLLLDELQVEINMLIVPDEMYRP